MTSPIPGAASELQVFTEKVQMQPDTDTVVRHVYRTSEDSRRQTNFYEVNPHAARVLIAALTPPAPVTEGAQLEAVAWRYVNADGKRLSEWKDGTPSNDEKASAGLLSLYIELAHSRPISPPPDRVQTRNPESSIAQPELVEFVGTRNPAPHAAPPSAPSSYTVHEISASAPPTDASGGVTDAMVQAAREAFAPNNWRATCSPQCMRAALEAADRARNSASKKAGKP